MNTLQEIPAYKRLPLDIVSAQGHDLILRDGRRVLDLYGGHCVNVLGAGDSGLRAVLDQQWDQLSFCTNLLDHGPREMFLESIGKNLPAVDDGWRVFVSNTGAEANENALKAAFAHTGRSRVVVFEGAFHGRTPGTAWLSDGDAPTPQAPFDFVRVPWNDLEAARAVLAEDIAAVFLEPIQSMAGVRTPDSEYLAGLANAAHDVGALLVFDEVQTGSGRLGSPWAAQHFDVVPDIFTTAKGAGGGFPIGMTFVRERALEGVAGSLFGSTFGGSPLALACAAHVAQRVSEPEFLAQVRETSEALCALGNAGPFVQTHGAGLLLGYEIEAGKTAAQVRDALLDADVLVGTSKDPQVLRISPALTLGMEQVERFARVVESLA